MFGLGKKKSEPGASPTKDKGAVKSQSEPAVPEENFTVMPEQYLPKGSAGSAGNKKLYFLIAGAALFLLMLSGGLYMFFFSGRSANKEIAVNAPAALVQNEPAAPAAVATTTSERVVESLSYDSANQLTGSLKMTVPALVANKYGESLGITTLAPTDLSLPTGSEMAGGIYSPYPLGALFAEPIAFELSVTALSASSTRAEFFPAYLKGAAWEEIVGHQDSGQGWSFTLDKFPSGPLSAVRRPVVATSTPPVAESGKNTPSQDTDSDGLTDKEEILLGTNVSSPDTDGDTYEDKAELLNNYSPLAPLDKLEAANLFSLYTNPTYGYKVSHPTKWLSDALDQTNKQVLFISDTEEFFEILIEENPAKKPIVDWYRSQSPTLANVELDVTVVDGAGAVWSPDGLTLYVGKEGLVYILTYNKGTLEAINWPTVFEYFYKSFKFGNTAGVGATE